LAPARLAEARFGNSLRNHAIGKVVPLFPPLEEKPGQKPKA